MTWLIRCGSTPGVPSTASIAATIPDVMSAGPGTLALASTRWRPASVRAWGLVPPTSTPRRQSGGGTGELLHGQVVELVAERARPGDRDSLPGPPDRVAAERDHGGPLAVGDPLGRDRAGRLAVQHRDQVRYRGEHMAALQRHQVLVLQLQPDQPARVPAQALDDDRAAGEPARRPALDVQDLPDDQAEGAELGDQGVHRAFL